MARSGARCSRETFTIEAPKTARSGTAAYMDLDGKRKHRPTHQPSKALAMRFVAEVEARVARGLVGIPDVTEPERQAGR